MQRLSVSKQAPVHSPGEGLPRSRWGGYLFEEFPMGLRPRKVLFVFPLISRLTPFSLILALAGAGHGESAQPPHPTGLLPPTPEEKAWLEKTSKWVTFPEKELEDLPSRVVNLEHLPPVGRQTIGSCASWSVVYYVKGWQEAKEHGITRPFPDEHVLSPAFVFQWVGISASQGSSFTANFRFLERYGTTTFDEFPETRGLLGEPLAPLDLWRSAAARRSATDSVGQIPTSTEEGLNTLKAVLASGELASAAVGVYKNFDEYPRSAPGVDNNVFYAEGTEGFRDNHAVTIIGYDDEITYHNGEEERQGAFLAVNSWGTSWGVSAEEGGERGYIWLAYEYFLNNEGAPSQFDFYTMENRIDYEPEHFVILDIFHPRRAEMSVGLLTRPREGNEQAAPLMPPARGLRPMDGPIAVDVTDHVTAKDEAFWIQVFDVVLPEYGSREPAVIREVIVEQEGRPPLVARENVPMSPINQLEESLPKAEQIPVSPTLRHEDVFPPHGLNVAEGGSWVGLDIADIYGEGTIDIVGLGEVLRMDGDRPVSHGSVPSGRYALGDYTNDGLPDLAVYGRFDGSWALRIYRNRGGGEFVEESLLPPDATGFPYWVDFNGNGKLDLVTLAGSDSAVWLNKGSGVFRDSGLELPRAPVWVSEIVDFDQDGLMDFGGWRNLGNGEWEPPPWDERAAVAWGDYNGNGLLDAAVVHSNELSVYRNDGDGEFTRVAEDLPAFHESTIRWADVNNNGRLDIVVKGNTSSGYYVSTISRTEVYLQNEDGTFRTTGMAIHGGGGHSGRGALALADFDGDGDIDFVTGGYPSVEGTTMSNTVPREVRYTESFWADEDGRARPNQAPSAPSSLNATPEQEAGMVTLRWDDAQDDRTPPRSMRYQLRVGSTPGGHEVVSAARSLAALPSSRLSPDQAGRHLQDLAAGTYYWSVRAMDASGAFSPWPAEQQFTIQDGAKQEPLFDPNQDGILDAADVAHLRGLVGSSSPEDLRVGDIDGSGSITTNDVRELARMLAGRPGTPTPPWMATVDGGGGTLELDDAEVTIPEGAIPGEPANMRLGKLSSTTFGPGNERYTPYRLSGIPVSLEKPVEVSIYNPQWRDDDWEDPLIVVGEESVVPSLGTTRLSYKVIEPDRIENNRLYFQLEPVEEEARKSLQKDEDFVDGEYSNDFWVLAGYSHYTTPNFRVAFPRAYDTEIVENLANDLEQAHARYREADMGFSYAARTQWPVSVTLKDLGFTTYGYAYSSRRGHNHGGLEFNTRLMDDPDARRITAFHEFFHLVEGFYDPRNAVRRGTTMSPHYTLSEMAATWAEEFAVANPAGYVPEEWHANRFVLFEAGGMDLPAEIQTDLLTRNASLVAAHGYAWAPMIRYLAQNQGNSVVRDIFRNVRAGQNWIRAIRNASDRAGFSWFHGFMVAYTLGEVYRFTYEDRLDAIAGNQLYLGDGNTHREFNVSMSNLSAQLYGVNVSVPWREQDKIDPEHRLGFRLDAPVNSRLSILSEVEGEQPEVVEFVDWEDDVSRYLTDSVHPVLSEPESAYFAVVTFDRSTPRHEEPEDFRILMALLEDKEVDTDAFTFDGFNFFDSTFPPVESEGGRVFVPASSKIQVTGMGDLPTTVLSGVAWEDEENKFEVSLPVTFPETVRQRPDRNEIWRIQSIDGYRLNMVERHEGDPVEVETYRSADGTFEFLPHVHEGRMEWNMTVHYTVEVTYTETDTETDTTTTHQGWVPLLLFSADAL